jgi:3,4-dihydroxy-2-butanone 4-phosphate synthase
MATQSLTRGFLSSPEELIDEARNGRMFILVDDEERENEGDLVIPAQMATPDAINFMATHGRGLVCLALTRERVDQLGLELMSRHNGTRHETAFTTSIEAKDGVTTGISAADRARTVSVAIDASKGPEHIVTPGHVFPLVAREGGVLIRAGHTEAAVDVARLAGLNPSGVICEIMREDGTMARMDDLVAFAQRHGLKIGTIRDLIAYRLKKDHLVEQTAETRFESVWGGTWTAKAFLNKAWGGRRWPWSRASSTRRGRPWSGCTSSTCSPTRSARPMRGAASSPGRCGRSPTKAPESSSASTARRIIPISSTPGPARRARTWTNCAIMAAAPRSCRRSGSTT